MEAHRAKAEWRREDHRLALLESHPALSNHSLLAEVLLIVIAIIL